jgi:hypothetical protein
VAITASKSACRQLAHAVVELQLLDRPQQPALLVAQLGLRERLPAPRPTWAIRSARDSARTIA